MDSQSESWYPLRVLYGRELKLKTLLDSMSVTSFVPMHYKKVIINGRETKKMTPVIRNLIFVKSGYPFLKMLKDKLEGNIPYRHIIDKLTKKPITVPTKEMDHFIAVAGTMDEQLIYLTKIESNLINGDKVLVTGGVFAGVEGRVVRIKKDRRVMVNIEGVAAVVTAYINPLLLQKTKIENASDSQCT